VNFYEWALLVAGVALLSLANYRFYFGGRRSSYLLFVLASLLFAGGFLLAGLVREDYNAALTLMLIYLAVYVVERVGFILYARFMRQRTAEGHEDEGNQTGQGDD
jgi:FtsH-binding integral membrane protein